MSFERKLIYRAGVIPYILENDKLLMMFMRPSDSTYGGSDWQLAKGKVEDDEDHQHAALREGKEELGLFVGNINKLTEVGVFMGRTSVYVAGVRSKDMFGEPSDETDATMWLSVEEFGMIGRELHQPVVKSAFDKIVEVEGLQDWVRNRANSVL